MLPILCSRSGPLIQLLVHTDVMRYLDFKVIEGSYVYKAGRVHNLPATEEDALHSGDTVSSAFITKINQEESLSPTLIYPRCVCHYRSVGHV